MIDPESLERMAIVRNYGEILSEWYDGAPNPLHEEDVIQIATRIIQLVRGNLNA